jgi:crotonobetainyl-CoA:carnitine CoA-transferase CaiB-like acyl-CoA transferase
MILAVGNDSQFAKFCDIAGHPEWAQDPRFTSNTLRVINRAELIPLMEVVFKTRTKADWLSTLEAAKVPCGPINNLAEVFADPHVQSREMINHWTHSSGGEMDLVASPLKLRGTPVRRDRPPPTMGQHTDEVLHEVLGLDASALAALRDQKII